MVELRSIEAPGFAAKEGETKPRMNKHLKDGQLKISPPGIINLEQNFVAAMKKHGESHKAFGYRPVLDNKGNVGPYKWLSFKEFFDRYHNIASGMLNIGINHGNHVGIFAKNRLEWLFVEYASLYLDVVPIPLYDTLTISEIIYMISEAEISTVYCTNDKVHLLISSLESIKDFLKIIVVMDEIAGSTKEECEKNNIQLFTVAELELKGQENPKEYECKADLDSTVTICYTSGTTGTPKGVVLTQKNFLSATESLDCFIKNGELMNIDNTDVYLSFLPLAHILERFLVHMLLSRGVAIGFSRGNVLKIMDDVFDLQPTIFVGVPRLFNRIKDRVSTEIAKRGGLAAFMFRQAFSSKQGGLDKGELNHWIWDKVVFSKIKAKLGGRIKLFVSGSAPISAETLDFMKICFSSNVIEGYGGTETTGVCSLTTIHQYTSGTVGVPFPNSMIKLVDVPELDYLTTDKPFPRGEVCVYGNGIFKEYYKQPEKTEEALDADGWYHSGDIGIFDDEGCLKIIDRKKNLFKLSQGEYVAPERVENVYINNPIVAQVFIYGDSLKSYLVGVIVPDEEMLMSALKKSGKDFDTSLPLADLCKDLEVRNFVIKNMQAWGKENKLRGFEQVKNVHLEHVPFEIGTLLSPSFKLKRVEATKHYIETLNILYEETGNY